MKGNTFRHILVTYLLCVAMLLIISAGTYAAAYNEFEKRCLRDCEQALNNGTENFHELIDKFSRLVAQQRSQACYTRVSTLSHPFSPRNMFWMEAARKQMAQSISDMSLDNYAADCALIYQNGACLTSQRSYEHLSQFYGEFFRYDNVSISEWRTALRQCAYKNMTILPAKDVYTRGKGTFSAITVVQSAKYHYGTDVVNVAFMLLDADSMLKSMLPQGMSEQCSISMYLNDTELAALGEKSGRSYSHSYALQSTSVAYPNINFIVKVPREYVHSQTQPMLAIFTYGLGALLAAGLMLAVFFARRNYKPVHALSHFLKEIGGNDPQANEYDYITHEIGIMHGDLNNARKVLQTREGELRSAAIQQLLCSSIVPGQEEQISRILFPELPHSYCLCIAKAQGISEFSKDALLKALRSALNSDICFHISGSLLIFALPIGEGMDNPHDYIELLEPILPTVKRDLSIQMTVALSDVFASRKSFPKAYEQAQQLIRILTADTISIAIHSDMPDPAAWVPIEYMDSKQFYESLMVLDSTHALEMVQSAFSCLRSTLHSDRYVEQVFFSFHRVFSRIKAQLSDSGVHIPAAPDYSYTASLTELSDSLVEHISVVLEGISQLHAAHASLLDNAILEYIEAHIGDCDICARTVAEHFSVADKDIQAVLHRSKGCSFFEYTEQLRMEKACHLIKSTSLPLSEIARICGFALPNSFYKAFKRRFSISPSAMRNQPDAIDK